jgi:hypothetical protein
LVGVVIMVVFAIAAVTVGARSFSRRVTIPWRLHLETL